MNERDAFLYVANWVEASLESQELNYYYWGYEDIAGALREAAQRHLDGVDEEDYDDGVNSTTNC